MTWENALFVVVGVGLMGLLEWARHHLEDWWTEEKTRTALMLLAAIIITACGVALIILMLRMK